MFTSFLKNKIDIFSLFLSHKEIFNVIMILSTIQLNRKK